LTSDKKTKQHSSSPNKTPTKKQTGWGCCGLRKLWASSRKKGKKSQSDTPTRPRKRLSLSCTCTMLITLALRLWGQKDYELHL